MKISILGTPYTIEKHTASEDEKLSECAGYCDWTTRKIVLEKDPGGDLGRLDVYARKVLRHEIVHSFLIESGLAEESGWALSEEMVDWFARQGPKIYAAWQQAEALDPEEGFCHA